MKNCSAERIPGVEYRCPGHKLYPPKPQQILEAEELIAKQRSSPFQRLSLAIHEAGHKRIFDECQIRTTYIGPSIIHRKETDEYVLGYGATVCNWDEWSSLTDRQRARIAVAGAVSESVLLKNNSPKNSEMDFLEYIQSGFAPALDLVLIWKQTEEEFRRELKSDLRLQQTIVHEAERFQQRIFGIDRRLSERS